MASPHYDNAPRTAERDLNFATEGLADEYVVVPPDRPPKAFKTLRQELYARFIFSRIAYEYVSHRKLLLLLRDLRCEELCPYDKPNYCHCVLSAHGRREPQPQSVLSASQSKPRSR